MSAKRSMISNIIKGKCPRCHGDYMYINQNPYVLSQTMQMHDHCSKCGLKYKIEPNFFFGAMYVSYGLAVSLGIFIFALSHYVFKTGLATAFIAIFVGLIVLMPMVTRLSRNIYIALFIRYRPELDQ